MIVWTSTFTPAFFPSTGGRRDGRLGRLGHLWNISGDRRSAEVSGNPRLTERESWKPQQNIRRERLVNSFIGTNLKILVLLHEERLSIISQLHMQAHRLPVDLDIHLWMDEYSGYVTWPELEDNLGIWILKTNQLMSEIRFSSLIWNKMM